jgi:acetyl-CoA acetyltransferase
MHEYGTTEVQLAKIAVKAHQIAKHNERARFRQEFTLEDVLNSAMVSYPLRLYEICPVSDGAAAVVLCSADVARAHTTTPVWVAASAIATALHNDGIPKGLGTVVPPGVTHHSEAAAAVKQAMEQSGITKEDLSLVELQDNTVYYELAFPEEWGLCEPGEAESLVEKGETMPDGRLPINPSGGFLCFGEATTAQGLFQICEMTYQLRGESGARQVPNARVALAQTLGLGGNASATVLNR